MVIIPTPFPVVLSFYPLSSPFILKIGTRKWPNRSLSTPFTEVEIAITEAFTVHLQTPRRGRREWEKTVQLDKLWYNRWGFVEIAAVIHHESITRWWRRLLSISLRQENNNYNNRVDTIGSTRISSAIYILIGSIGHGLKWTKGFLLCCFGLNKTKQHSSVHIY